VQNLWLVEFEKRRRLNSTASLHKAQIIVVFLIPLKIEKLLRKKKNLRKTVEPLFFTRIFLTFSETQTKLKIKL
jgi:hypothetical protein